MLALLLYDHFGRRIIRFCLFHDQFNRCVRTKAHANVSCDTRNTVFCIASAAVTVATAGKTEFA